LMFRIPLDVIKTKTISQIWKILTGDKSWCCMMFIHVPPRLWILWWM
jgi:hypothetical protein